MKHLLQQPADQGYPAEYLIARIRGRRSRLIAEWRPLVFEPDVSDYLASGRYQGFVRERSPDRIWRNLLQEYGWVYRQMNEQLRAVFRPFILYTELKTLFICLREAKDRNLEKADLLEASLLSDRVKTVLTTAPDPAAALPEIEKLFLPLSGQFSGLAKTLETNGLRGVEQKLVNTFLAAVAGMRRLHPVMKTFFVRLIDSRNILSAYKFLKLEEAGRPPFLPGGTMPETGMREVIQKDDLMGICSLVRQYAGIRIDRPDPTKVELALYRGITAFLKKEGREPFGPGPLLDYLWKCSLEVMNLSLLLSTRDLERDLVAAELVQ